MAENIDQIKSILKQYIKIIKQHKIEIEKIYLFGSYALGTATDESDINIAIISNDFEGDRFLDRRKIVPLRRKIDRRIEPIPFRTEDFKKSDPLALEIMTHGIEI